MGILTDEPPRHTRHSAALRYLDIRDDMAGNRRVLRELPFADHRDYGRARDSVCASRDERGTEMMEEVVQSVNNNEIVGLGSRDVPVVKKERSRMLYIQTPEESRRMRRIRDPEGKERDRFRRLIRGDTRRQGDRGEMGVDLKVLL